MKELVVLSGKGGTGKTTITAALAHLAAGELSLVLAEHESHNPKRIEPVVFGGRGLSAEFQGRSWADIRDEIYRSYGT